MLTFPWISVTVRVTLFGPIFELLNVFGETFIVDIIQLSEDPLST